MSYFWDNVNFNKKKLTQVAKCRALKINKKNYIKGTTKVMKIGRLDREPSLYPDY